MIPLIRLFAKSPLQLPTLTLLIVLLSGCENSGKKAPEPVINKEAHRTSEMKISVAEGSGVTRVEVYSTWTIHNMWCAPTRYPSGSFITKDIEVKERVEKESDYEYIAAINVDRFIQDNCKWGIGGYDVKFMRDHALLATGAIGLIAFKKSNTLELTSVSEDKPPICWSRSREAFLRSHFDGVFNVTLEIER